MLLSSPKASPNIPIGVTNSDPIPHTMPIITPDAIAIRSGARLWAKTVATGWLANRDMPAATRNSKLSMPSVLTKAKAPPETSSEITMTQEPE